MAENDSSFVILIDTNAMSALSIYVESCSAVNTELGAGIEDLKEKFKKKIEREEVKFEEYLELSGRCGAKAGFDLFWYLKNKNTELSNNVKIYFSFFSQVELFGVFLDRVFDHKLTRQGVPYRIRKKKPFRVQIGFNYQEEVVDFWEEIKDKLMEQGIKFEVPEYESHSEFLKDAMQVLKIVSKYLALETMDLYLYATGISLRVDEIYTHDDDFRKIINNIREDPNWKNIFNSIQKDLIEKNRSFYMEFESKGKITLPKGVPHEPH
uniref:Uncharacterized protein n=1 Tax=candidate division CPR3 bacterium TaxID=2268181 RepID=A0A7V3J916_UNCC3